MCKHPCSIVLLALIAVAVIPCAYGHTVIPGNLEILAQEDSTYQVVWTPPTIPGRTSRNEEYWALNPIITGSEVISEVSESSGSRSKQFVRTWEMRVEGKLSNQFIHIVGLEDTDQVSVLGQITLPSGRSVVIEFTPDTPGVLVPDPQPIHQLVIDSSVAGVARTTGRIELWIVLIALGMIVDRKWRLFPFLLLMLFAQVGGQVLTYRSLSYIPMNAPTLTAAVAATSLALMLASGWRATPIIAKTAILCAPLLGLIYGMSDPDIGPHSDLIAYEWNVALISFSVGSLIAMFVMQVAAIQLGAVFTSFPYPRVREHANLIIGYGCGIAATCLILIVTRDIYLMPYESSAYAPTLIVLSIALGMWLGHTTSEQGPLVVPVFIVFLALGGWIGLTYLPLPQGTSIVIAAVILVGMRAALGRTKIRHLDKIAIPAVIVFHGWYTAGQIVDQLSYPQPIAIGTATIALYLFCLSYFLTNTGDHERTLDWLSIAGRVVVVVALAWLAVEYTTVFETQYASEWSLGFIRLPLLSAALLLGAVFMWPRRSKALEQVGVEWKRPVAHWALLMCAILLFPFGSLQIQNPWFEPDAPKAGAAKRVLTHVLSNTYEAFNIKDEQALYDRISENVSGNLVAEMYLKSRQHVMSGTLKGATITIKDVSVLNVDDSVQGTQPGSGFTYDCKWQVVARVQHMAHVHHRRNVYNGELTISFEDNAWKLVDVQLKSEERVVVPWKET